MKTGYEKYFMDALRSLESSISAVILQFQLLKDMQVLVKCVASY
jgi:hypothetical protein